MSLSQASKNTQWLAGRTPDTYFKRCLWSPDTRILLVQDNTNTLQTFTFNNLEHASRQVSMNTMPSCNFPVSTPIHDICWYPWANTSEPSSLIFISSSHQQPIKLWDSQSGRVRCTFVCKDERTGELCTPLATVFSANGQKIYSSTRGNVQIFSSHTCQRIESIQSRESFSCLTRREDDSGLLVGGSIDRDRVCVFDVNGGGEIITNLQCSSIPGHGNDGISCLKMCGDWKLIAQQRRTAKLTAWDLRMPGQPIHHQQSNQSGEDSQNYPENGNQRTYFDIVDDLIVCGGGGNLNFFDTQNLGERFNVFNFNDSENNDIDTGGTKGEFTMNKDSSFINSVSVGSDGNKGIFFALATGKAQHHCDELTEHDDHCTDSIDLKVEDKVDHKGFLKIFKVSAL